MRQNGVGITNGYICHGEHSFEHPAQKNANYSLNICKTRKKVHSKTSPKKLDGEIRNQKKKNWRKRMQKE